MYITTCAFFTHACVRSTPIASITSSVSRKPAVSIRRNLIPPNTHESSKLSRVVPAISETIARSSFNKAFSKVDFPALGLPTITVATPFLIAFPARKLATKGRIASNNWFTKSSKSFRSANSTSSSPKSNSNSIKDAK